MSQKSTDYKRQFNAEKYGRIEVHLPKDLVDKFKATCKERRTSQAAVIKKAVEDYIEEVEKMKGYVIVLEIYFSTMNMTEHYVIDKNMLPEEIREDEWVNYSDYSIDPDFLANMDDDYEKHEQQKYMSKYAFKTIVEAKEALVIIENDLQTKEGFVLSHPNNDYDFEICEVELF